MKVHSKAEEFWCELKRSDATLNAGRKLNSAEFLVLNSIQTVRERIMLVFDDFQII